MDGVGTEKQRDSKELCGCPIGGLACVTVIRIRDGNSTERFEGIYTKMQLGQNHEREGRACGPTNKGHGLTGFALGDVGWGV